MSRTALRAQALGLLVLTPVFVVVAGCSATIESGNGPSGDANQTGLPGGSDWRIVELTHELSPDSIYWPNGSAFEFEREVWGHDEAGDWYAMARYATPEHLGTHLDAPVHFAENGWTTAEIPLERLIGPAVVIDISARAAENADAALQPDDVDAWEARNGKIPDGAIVLVRSRWSERWPDWNTYYGSDDPFDTTSLHFPGVSPEAAQALVSRRVAGVGVDTTSVDPGNDTAFRAHRLLGPANIFNLENLTNLSELPESGAMVFALPIKIAGGSGGQARVVALVR